MQQKIADEQRSLTIEQRNMAIEQRNMATEQRNMAIEQGKIAVATAQDSSAMKSIALLTMVFLPTTALAVSDSLYIPKTFYVQ